jgi:hypothetical protein
MSREEHNKINYIVALIAEFAETHKLSNKDALNYVMQYKGMEYILKFYEVLHTLSFREVVNDITTICSRNGGNIINNNETLSRI